MENFAGRSNSAGDGAVDRAGVAGDVGGFAGEEQGLIDGLT